MTHARTIARAWVRHAGRLTARTVLVGCALVVADANTPVVRTPQPDNVVECWNASTAQISTDPGDTCP